MKEVTVKVSFQNKTKEIKITQFTSLEDAVKHLGMREVRKIVNRCFRQDQLDLARKCWEELLEPTE